MSELKVLVDSEVLINALTQPNIYPDAVRLIDLLVGEDAYSLWLSALSLAHIRTQCHVGDSGIGPCRLLGRILEKASVIPFRRQTFLAACEVPNGGFMPSAMLAAAEELKIRIVVADQPGQYPATDLVVLDPESFMARHEAGDFRQPGSIPLLDLAAQLHRVYTGIDEALTDIIASNGFILGKYVEAFEKAFAEAHSARYALAVSSGTDALHIALAALDIGPGDAVALPVNTFIATAEAVSLTGAQPLFVDCDAFYNISVTELARLFDEASKGCRPMPKAVIPVHLYGQPADMDPILEIAGRYGAAVVEDACQAHLARYKGRNVGKFGRFAAFSFYPGKNLGAYGEGGALLTDDEELYKIAKMIRQHGEIERYHHERIGHNYRMEAIQGAVLLNKLPHLAEWSRRRRENARIYNECLSEVSGVRTPAEPDTAECVYHLYVVQAADRDGLQQFLGENGISTGLHYPVPLHLQEAYARLGHRMGDFPCAEAAAARILSLPMFPELSEGQIRHVCDCIKRFYGK